MLWAAVVVRWPQASARGRSIGSCHVPTTRLPQDRTLRVRWCERWDWLKTHCAEVSNHVVWSRRSRFVCRRRWSTTHVAASGVNLSLSSRVDRCADWRRAVVLCGQSMRALLNPATPCFAMAAEPRDALVRLRAYAPLDDVLCPAAQGFRREPRPSCDRALIRSCAALVGRGRQDSSACVLTSRRGVRRLSFPNPAVIAVLTRGCGEVVSVPATMMNCWPMSVTIYGIKNCAHRKLARARQHCAFASTTTRPPDRARGLDPGRRSLLGALLNRAGRPSATARQ